MVRNLAFYLISILLISSCGINAHRIGQTGGDDDQSSGGSGPTLNITAPNNGVSFSTRQGNSLVISGVCDKGADVTLTTIPERNVVNNCATNGTWSFATGTLSSGANTFSISMKTQTKNITITADLAASMTVTIDKSSIAVGQTANLQIHYWDIHGAEILIPKTTSPHSLSFSSGDENVATVVSNDAPAAAPAAALPLPRF